MKAKQTPGGRDRAREGERELTCSWQSRGPAVRTGRFCAKSILGHVTRAELLSHSAEPSKSTSYTSDCHSQTHLEAGVRTGGNLAVKTRCCLNVPWVAV